MTTTPDLTRSRAILIGNSHFADAKIPDLPAAASCVEAMVELLTGELCGWPADRVTCLLDVASPSELARRLITSVKDVQDTVLLYYVGHGMRTSEGQLALALADTEADPESLPHTASLYEAVAKILRGCPARTKLVILDCCHAELGTRANFQFQSADMAEAYPVDGLYFIGASKRHEKAKAPIDGALTYFTGAFLETVRSGLPGGPEMLRLDQIFVALRGRLLRGNLPEPVESGSRGARQYPFARNAAPPEPVEEHAELEAAVWSVPRPPELRVLWRSAYELVPPAVRRSLVRLSIGIGIALVAAVVGFRVGGLVGGVFAEVEDQGSYNESWFLSSTTVVVMAGVAGMAVGLIGLRLVVLRRWRRSLGLGMVGVLAGLGSIVIGSQFVVGGPGAGLWQSPLHSQGVVRIITAISFVVGGVLACYIGGLSALGGVVGILGFGVCFSLVLQRLEAGPQTVYAVLNHADHLGIGGIFGCVVAMGLALALAVRAPGGSSRTRTETVLRILAAGLVILACGVVGGALVRTVDAVRLDGYWADSLYSTDCSFTIVGGTLCDVELHSLLHQQGYPGAYGGFSDTNMQAALTSLQHRSGLPATGLVDAATKKALYHGIVHLTVSEGLIGGALTGAAGCLLVLRTRRVAAGAAVVAYAAVALAAALKIDSGDHPSDVTVSALLLGVLVATAFAAAALAIDRYTTIRFRLVRTDRVLEQAE